ncbi:MAG TPA: NADH dehydrogenase (quinone) subunit D [Planctomycetota bacterium]|nr:NADH dehydrogenase (quinone) subunit D [Planctomycetota bacterium]
MSGQVDIVLDRPQQPSEHQILNMGPQHPSTHGVLRLVLELDGEIIVNCTPVVGYLHRAMEKIAESMTFNMFTPYTDRLDYLAPLANNVALSCAQEHLLGIDIPPRAKAIRVICCEMSRISAHLLGLGAFAMDVGAMTAFLWFFREREKIYNLIEHLSGARFTTSYTRVGGVAADMPEGFLDELRAFVDQFPSKVEEVEKLLTTNRIWVERTKDLGVVTPAEAVAWGLTGPNLRGSGVEWDCRLKRPYLAYETYDFEVPVGSVGDAYDRYLVRIEEMKESTKILRQAIGKMPGGPVNVEDSKISLPKKSKVLMGMDELIHQFILVTEGQDAPPGESYFGAENPKGELGFYFRSKGGGYPDRMFIRSPSFVNLQILPKLVQGRYISDVVAILGSLDFVMGECDR